MSHATPALSPAVALIPPHGTRAIAGLAAGRGDVINLTFGEPDFPTPEHIAEAGVDAIRAGHTRYAPGAGIPQLREAAAAGVTARTGASVGPDQVVITAGAVLGVFAAFAALVPRGGRVLVPDPGWPCYVGQSRVLGLEPVPYRLDASDRFEPDLDALDAQAEALRASLLVLNNPGNPTGAVWGQATVEACLEIARRHEMWVIADEVYDEITFDREHVSTVALAHDDQVVTVFSLSKTYAMTGWRVGYLVAAPEVAATIIRVLEHAASSVGMPSQYAGIAALTGPQDSVAEMREAYMGRRDLAVRVLEEEHLLVDRPDGAFYAFADISAATRDSWSFATELARRPDGVACAPGDSFGAAGAGLLRVSLAASAADIEEGIRRIGRAVRDWRASAQ